MEYRQWKGSPRMIDSVDRIVRTPIRECPPFVEAAFIHEASPVVQTFWFAIEPHATLEDVFIVTDEGGQVMRASGSTIVQWLKPEDMNNPAVQAELIVGLAQMGMEL